VLALALVIGSLVQGGGVVEDLAGVDRAAQAAAIEALGSTVEFPGPAAEIAAALALRAGLDEDVVVRRACLEALGRRGDAAALSELAELVATQPQAEQVWAVQAMGATPGGRARAWVLVCRAIEPGLGRDHRAALPWSELVRIGAPSLAEGGSRAWTLAEIRPLARLARSADRLVAETVRGAVEDLLKVLEATRGELALVFLEALREAGYPAELVADHSCAVGLYLGEVELVLEVAGELCAGAHLAVDALSCARGYGYLATARFLKGEYEAAAAGFHEQREVAEALVRRPLSGRSDLALRSVAAQLAAIAEVSVALSELAGGARASESRVLDATRRAHVLALRAHALGARADQGSYVSLDFLFGSHPAPWGALEGPRPLPGLESGAGLRWRRELLAAFATIAPEELPGITPLGLEGVATTARDSDRLRLVFEIIEAREERLHERTRIARARLRAALGRGEAGADLSEELDEMTRDLNSLRGLRTEPIEELLVAIRRPSSVALELAVGLREEGRQAEARALLEPYIADMQRGGRLQRYVWAIQSTARAEASLGSCLCDEDQPEAAERVFLRAVQRLEDLERHLSGRGIDASAYGDITALRAGTLISLAVNSNVRLGDSERALAYFERAYELRQDSFTTVLLACYRARSGRMEEARVALARVVEEPFLYYNLACTHALLGDTQQALSFLELELSVNHTTRGARERQRAWARDDPDLRSLRDESRFAELTMEP
jgi:tetratricopeptide (TPR) repeat protein